MVAGLRQNIESTFYINVIFVKVLEIWAHFCWIFEEFVRTRCFQTMKPFLKKQCENPDPKIVLFLDKVSLRASFCPSEQMRPRSSVLRKNKLRLMKFQPLQLEQTNL